MYKVVQKLPEVLKQESDASSSHDSDGSWDEHSSMKKIRKEGKAHQKKA